MGGTDIKYAIDPRLQVLIIVSSIGHMSGSVSWGKSWTAASKS